MTPIWTGIWIIIKLLVGSIFIIRAAYSAKRYGRSGERDGLNAGTKASLFIGAVLLLWTGHDFSIGEPDSNLPDGTNLIVSSNPLYIGRYTYVLLNYSYNTSANTSSNVNIATIYPGYYQIETKKYPLLYNLSEGDVIRRDGKEIEIRREVKGGGRNQS